MLFECFGTNNSSSLNYATDKVDPIVEYHIEQPASLLENDFVEYASECAGCHDHQE